MGPRLDSRGNTDFGVEIVHDVLLQWGRDLIVAETGDNPRETREKIVTSMGPRLDSRGNLGLLVGPI